MDLLLWDADEADLPSTFRYFDKLNTTHAQTLDKLRRRATLRSGTDCHGFVPT